MVQRSQILAMCYTIIVVSYCIGSLKPTKIDAQLLANLTSTFETLNEGTY